jgi:hypothetical protein
MAAAAAAAAVVWWHGVWLQQQSDGQRHSHTDQHHIWGVVLWRWQQHSQSDTETYLKCPMGT